MPISEQPAGHAGGARQRPETRSPAVAAGALLKPVATLRGVGAAVSGRLLRLGVERIGDLLWLLPVRYEDRTEIRPLGSLRSGDKALVQGRLELVEVAMRRRRSLLCRLADGTGAITLRFFHFSAAQRESLRRGQQLRCYGEVRLGPTGLEIVHPEYRVVTGDEPAERTLTPVYPATEGLHQQRIRSLVSQALEMLELQPMPDYLARYLPADWPDVTEALMRIHRPPQGTPPDALLTGREPHLKRLALEELVAHRLSLKRDRAIDTTTSALALTAGGDTLQSLRASLPFTLTAAQDRAIADVVDDIQRTTPMQRLLQGDVGSGKTVVAAAAAVVAAAAGAQTAVMAPTELLAEQHLANLAGWLEPLGIAVAGLTGSTTGKARAAIEAGVADGGIAVVTGTHALFQSRVSFHRLGLVIVDEQHRFGVEQRLQLTRKSGSGHAPHQLIMTATPIPRTLAMTAYADLACSVIDELPPGREPVRTVVIPDSRRPELVQRVAAHCGTGQQAYWVCPLIEESEALDSSAAEQLMKDLSDALPELSVGLVHGRMKPAAKEAAMRAFKEKYTQLLVATTVIEVGVDVPNATLMVIENAERMGLAQLHQLRGRVGRGRQASSCVLIYKPPLSQVARERLRVLRETTDGFVVAEQDLRLRGPGEVLGTRQTGVMALRVADLMRDAALLPEVVRISESLAVDSPDAITPLLRRWIQGAAEYARV